MTPETKNKSNVLELGPRLTRRRVEELYKNSYPLQMVDLTFTIFSSSVKSTAVLSQAMLSLWLSTLVCSGLVFGLWKTSKPQIPLSIIK